MQGFLGNNKSLVHKAIAVHAIEIVHLVSSRLDKGKLSVAVGIDDVGMLSAKAVFLGIGSVHSFGGSKCCIDNHDIAGLGIFDKEP